MEVRMLVASEDATMRDNKKFRENEMSGWKTYRIFRSSQKQTDTLRSREGRATSSAAQVMHSAQAPLAPRNALVQRPHPNSASARTIPILPVSGAEQLTASEAIWPPRPRSSAITPYYYRSQQRHPTEHSRSYGAHLEVRERDAELRVVCLAEE